MWCYMPVIVLLTHVFQLFGSVADDFWILILKYTQCNIHVVWFVAISRGLLTLDRLR